MAGSNKQVIKHQKFKNKVTTCASFLNEDADSDLLISSGRSLQILGSFMTKVNISNMSFLSFMTEAVSSSSLNVEFELKGNILKMSSITDLH